ncbi:E3 ubiquitin-protein ligase UPL6 isoform X3 [Vigna radiata var. radiata]|uniref:HECT-type E3 ubiquitin transferase n=1 Tax=Vigna radiata var. radiata TaxID=3916 RepID=A0A1S3USN9_VIGRR|nr:E3 ubiquitin-protein ligase UPL6 isoform X3 [Vigna radiata var. radiata]
MFFSGDPSTRKRVDLGGRSSKERDRKNLLEQTRVERNRRLWLRQQNSAVLKIQKCFRGRKAVKTEQSKLREQFYEAYGKYCQNVDRNSFGPDSDFLCQFLYFFKADDIDDFLVLVQICRLLWWFVQNNGDVVNIFAGVDYSSTYALVNYRVKQFVQACIHALHQNRNQLKGQLLLTPEELNVSAVPLLEVLVLLIDSKLPWSCKIVEYLFRNNALGLLREIILTGKGNDAENYFSIGKGSSLERVLMAVVRHVGQEPCICSHINPRYTFASQIITIPFLWHLFPNLQQMFAAEDLSQFYMHQMAKFGQNMINFLPKDISNEFPSRACMLGNVLEIAGIALSHPLCSFDMAIDLAAVTTVLLEALPSAITSNGSMSADDDMTGDEVKEIALDRKLEQQINNAVNPRFLLQLTNILFKEISSVNDSDYGPNDREVTAVDAVCGFLHVTFGKLPLERIMTVLAYRTELVITLWNFTKKCHENQKWSSLTSNDAPGWLLPLAVFCPVYKHMLMIVDNEEFYEQEKPLSLKDIRTLIIILRQVLWQLLWVNHTTSSNSVKSVPNSSVRKGRFVQAIQQRVSIAVSELLSQLQDWNNRRQFTSPSNFHADGVNDLFISQALIENTRANEILKQAPFLIPFTSRVKIYSSQLAAVRQRHGSQAVFSRNRFRIKRDRILEDAYNQMSQLTENSLRGLIRVTFVNEFGVEEAGIDGGGIFKDFMENITRAAFDVQYGLFKETADHLLYPNPGSGMIHEQHFQFFHFLGTLLAKAMFEGILVDIPFATFFLSKLKQKYNYLNDLPSLDPELYRHLIFLKHYKGDISELELYFVIVNNEYGEQTEEELLPGGRNLRVTNENVITFIHLVANHRLNFQIRQQSSHFLRGFEQLIQKDWIDMFNEQELQLLISGSVDSLDIDDLRLHTNYAGDYRSDHYVIEMFWEVLKGFSLENRKKFLKFVTGCSRGPLLGFRNLEPLFCIQSASSNAAEESLDRLPTSATCMNLLKLPPYTSKEQLETKLLYAINADAGFDLS